MPKQKKRTKFPSLKKEVNENSDRTEKKELSRETLSVGDVVWVSRVRSFGIVMYIPSTQKSQSKAPLDKTITVVVGSLKMNIKASEVTPHKPPQTQHKPPVGYLDHLRSLAKPHHERREPVRCVDLHGLTIREAIEKVEKALNQCILADTDSFSIIHGLGTGALQQAVHQYLNSSPVVARSLIRPQNPGETIVFLHRR